MASEIGLKYSTVLTEWEAQTHRTKDKYKTIIQCSAIVIGVACAVTLLALSAYSLSIIPTIKVLDTVTGKFYNQIAPGFEGIEALSIVGISAGPILGVLVGLAIYGIGTWIANHRIKKCFKDCLHDFHKCAIANLSKEELAKINALPLPQACYANAKAKRRAKSRFKRREKLKAVKNQLVQGKLLTSILQKANTEILQHLIPQMNFDQLYYTRKIIGKDRFNQLILHPIDGPISEEHALWRDIVSFQQAKNPINQLENSLSKIDVKSLSSRFPKIKGLFLEKFQKVNGVGAKVAATNIWLKHTQGMEYREVHYHLVSQDSVGKNKLRFKIKQSENSTCSVKFDISKPWLKTNGGQFWQTILEQEENRKTYALEFSDPEAFDLLLKTVSTADPTTTFSPEMMQRILRASTQYLPDYTDTLQWTCSEADLSDPAFAGYLKQRSL